MHSAISRQTASLSLSDVTHVVPPSAVVDHSPSKRRERSFEKWQSQSQLTMSKYQRAACDSEQTRVIYNGIQQCEYKCRKIQTQSVPVGYMSVCPIDDKMHSGKPTPFGRPVDNDFESAVVAKVIGKVLPKMSKSDATPIVHPLKDIIVAGIATAAEFPFRDRNHIHNLKFSKCWARGVLRRHSRFLLTYLLPLEA